MSLPPSFSGMPQEEQQHYYRNVCIEFKKAIKSRDPQLVEEKLEYFVNASRKVHWPHSTDSVFRKDPTEKAVQKVVSECTRYLEALRANNQNANGEDTLSALAIVESMIDQLKVR